MTERLGSLALRAETDVLTVRRRARDLADSLGFDTTDQVRIATAISELGRVIGAAGATARVDFDVDQADRATLVITAHPDRALTPPTRPLSVTGLVAIRRLMDRVVVGDDNAITMTKNRSVAHRPATERTLTQLREDLARSAAPSPMEELRTQHDELLRALDEVQSKQDELVRLNEELQETNRGVVALYAELDERGEQLRAANDAKSRFLTNVSHELRSPLNSINGLAQLLRDPETDPLTPSQDNQIRLIAEATTELLVAVNGLLDLARAEAGRIEPDNSPIDIATLVADMRATLRAQIPSGVELVVNVADDLGMVVTDGVLLGQLVRNLISNALKFTESGQVIVTVTADRGGDDDDTAGDVEFVNVEVRDSGIGIAPEHHDLIFEEFYRVPGHLQVRTRSTGLGLPYARRVASALGGTLSMTSTPGQGSTFTARVRNAWPPAPAPPIHLDRVLVGDDDPAFREVLRGLLSGLADVVVDVGDADGVLAALAKATPDLLLLDLRMPGGGGERVLADIEHRPDGRELRVIVISSASDELARLQIRRPDLQTIDKISLDRLTLTTAIAAVVGGTR
jgi:signal transduction histidine kinase